FWCLVSHKTVTWLSSLQAGLTFDQTALQGGFFVFRARDYALTAMISRRSSKDLPKKRAYNPFTSL
ncbi:hypothetical protein NL511_28260, partial [Klebsiella pneumoniae]|nr:hypothetical protein [Klebsiella pneumoniae]